MSARYGPSLCAGTEFDAECDCECPRYDGTKGSQPKDYDCQWPDCGCGCKPLCSGCDAVQAHGA